MIVPDDVLELLIPKDALRITIPYLPPSANSHYIRTRRGGIALSKAALKYRWDVRLLAASILDNLPQNAALGVYIRMYLPAGKRMDADNVLKETLDALKFSVVNVDDAAFKLVISRCIDNAETMKTEIAVWPLVVN